MTDPFIIMSAPNGARRQKTDHPNIPITPQEMATCAEEIIAAGASILHLHVRDDQGHHSLDVDRYRASIAAIREAVGDDIIIQATSEAVGRYSRLEQIAMVKELRPEAVSLALRELCPAEEDMADLSRFVDWMTAEHIFPQYILYDEVDYQRFEAYRQQGIFQDDHPFVLFVLGRYLDSAPEGDIEQLKQRTTEAVFPWAVCGFGINEVNSVVHAAQNNGHIRVGFENNIWRTQDDLLSTNAEMVQFCSEAAKAENRPVASVSDVKNMFNIR